MNRIWRKYGSAWLINRVPHAENKDINDNDAKNILRVGGGSFARWTTNFDKSAIREWWWCLKDDEIHLEQLTAKQRYRINKGLKSIDVIRVPGQDADKYAQTLYELAIEKLNEYPPKYRPQINKEEYLKAFIYNAAEQDYWICRDIETGIICGYAKCMFKENIVVLAGVKVLQAFMNKEVNAVLIYKICEYYLNKEHKDYVCDGERNIKHETNYQTYLCRVLNFRYAYCDLHIVYNPYLSIIVKILYPFRGILKHFSSQSNFIYNVFCVLEQERIARLFRR